MALPLPVNDPSMLPESSLIAMQNFLMGMGFNPGPIDGLWGPTTKAAWDAYRLANNATWDEDTYNRIATNNTEGLQRGEWTDTPVADDPPDNLDVDDDDYELDEDEEARIREEYPAYAYLLDHEDIGPLLREAVRDGRDATWLTAKIEQTPWFQETDANRRLFDTRLARDPATVDAEIRAKEVSLANLFDAYGIDVDAGTLTDVATRILRNGLTEEEELRIIGSMARTNAIGSDSNGQLGGSLGGSLSTNYQILQQIASDYGLTYSEDQFEEMAIRIMEGRWSREAAEAAMTRQAAEMYPHLADRLAEGMTVTEYFAPVKQRLAQTLGMNAADIDLNDKRWGPVTDVYDDGHGNYRTMTFAELNKFARKQDEWWATDQAAQEGYSLANKLLRTFGAI